MRTYHNKSFIYALAIILLGLTIVSFLAMKKIQYDADKELPATVLQVPEAKEKTKEDMLKELGIDFDELEEIYSLKRLETL